MLVTIPACEQHEGILSLTVEISDTCPRCGGPRGVDTLRQALSYDGSRRLGVSAWDNPCGHVDSYSAVREEVRLAGLAKMTLEEKAASYKKGLVAFPLWLELTEELALKELEEELSVYVTQDEKEQLYEMYQTPAAVAKYLKEFKDRAAADKWAVVYEHEVRLEWSTEKVITKLLELTQLSHSPDKRRYDVLRRILGEKLQEHEEQLTSLRWELETVKRENLEHRARMAQESIDLDTLKDTLRAEIQAEKLAENVEELLSSKADEEPIKEIHIVHEKEGEEPSARLVRVLFKAGAEVEICGTYGGFEQYGGKLTGEAEFYPISQPIAEKYVKWLNGGRLPAPFAKYFDKTLTK